MDVRWIAVLRIKYLLEVTASAIFPNQLHPLINRIATLIFNSNSGERWFRNDYQFCPNILQATENRLLVVTLIRMQLIHCTYLTWRKPKVFHFATVAFLSDNVIVALALPVVAVALFRAAFIAHTRLAIFEGDSISKKARTAQTARLAKRVVQTLQAIARHRIARARIFRINVTRALTRLTEISWKQNDRKVNGCTSMQYSQIQCQKSKL